MQREEEGGGGERGLKAKTKSNEHRAADAERSFSPRESIYGESTPQSARYPYKGEGYYQLSELPVLRMHRRTYCQIPFRGMASVPCHVGLLIAH